MKKLLTNNHADAKMIGSVVGLLITIIIAVLVLYSIAGGIDTTTVDQDLPGYHNATSGNTDATNATDDILDQSATFFQIAPIIAIVVVAVVILGYVGKIGGT